MLKKITLVLCLVLAACTAVTPERLPSPTTPPASTALPSATPPSPTQTRLPPTPTRPKLPAFEPQPDDFFVAPDGDDANPGTFEQPWATVNRAADTLTAGQTVYIRGGMYTLAAAVRLKNSGTPAAWITYAAYPGEQPIWMLRLSITMAPGRFRTMMAVFTSARWLTSA
jgi:hypothetical protein